YMVPALIETIDALPHLPTGKLNRAALRPPSIDIRKPADRNLRPRTETERRIGEVVEKLFHTGSVSIDDDFFRDLGGHSLLAARLVSELRTDFRFAGVSMVDVYDFPTIA